MKNIKQIHLFISCPRDIIDEIDSINLVVHGINKSFGKQNNFSIELVHWNEDTYTGIGDDAQEVINSQIEYDILVGLMWMRIGTKTKRDKSGTIEEINRALSNTNKEQLIYFKTTPPANLNELNTNDLDKVNSYKKELSKRGVLYKEFNEIDKFESLFRINLSNLISDKFLIDKEQALDNKPANLQSIPKIKNKKYSDIADLINEVENSENNNLEVDIFSLQEVSTSNLNSVTKSLTSMTASTETLSINLEKRTNEINTFNKIKDHRLKMKKIKGIINFMSKELDEYNKQINIEIPVFSENIISVGNDLSDMILASNAYDSGDESGLRESSMEFRNSMENAMTGLAVLLRTIIELPPINFTFNKSKRETEITLKNLIKEMKDGLILMDAALDY